MAQQPAVDITSLKITLQREIGRLERRLAKIEKRFETIIDKDGTRWIAVVQHIEESELKGVNDE